MNLIRNVAAIVVAIPLIALLLSSCGSGDGRKSSSAPATKASTVDITRNAEGTPIVKYCPILSSDLGPEEHYSMYVLVGSNKSAGLTVESITAPWKGYKRFEGGPIPNKNESYFYTEMFQKQDDLIGYMWFVHDSDKSRIVKTKEYTFPIELENPEKWQPLGLKSRIWCAVAVFKKGANGPIYQRLATEIISGEFVTPKGK